MTDITLAAEAVIAKVREDEAGFGVDQPALLHEFFDAPAVLAEVAEAFCSAEEETEAWYDWMDAVSEAADDILAAGR